jgi:hypothetical protein
VEVKPAVDDDPGLGIDREQPAKAHVTRAETAKLRGVRERKRLN